MKQIAPAELGKKNDSSILVLDIRDADAYNQWNIEGSQNIDVYNDIWEGNFDSVRKKLIQLPKDKKIVTVCNAGITSQNVSMILESLGYDTLVLERGMMGWNALHQSIDIVNDKELILKQVIRVGKGCLSYLIGSKSAKECLIVDPSQFTEEYANIVKQHNLRIVGVLDTHVHADHISGAKQLANLAKSKYYISSRDFTAKADFIDLKNNDIIEIGKSTVKIIETPGHTNGSMCFLVNDLALVTGDTLLLDGVGRPDLGRAESEMKEGARFLFSSLNKLKNLDKNLIVLPAHFTNYEKVPICLKLGTVLNTNESLKMDSEQEFVKFALDYLAMTPPNYQQIKNINNSDMQIPRQMCEQLEFGPNRCASR